MEKKGLKKIYRIIGDKEFWKYVFKLPNKRNELNNYRLR